MIDQKGPNCQELCICLIAPLRPEWSVLELDVRSLQENSISTCGQMVGGNQQMFERSKSAGHTLAMDKSFKSVSDYFHKNKME